MKDLRAPPFGEISQFETMFGYQAKIIGNPPSAENNNKS
jgi:hypothetical protein